MGPELERPEAFYVQKESRASHFNFLKPSNPSIICPNFMETCRHFNRGDIGWMAASMSVAIIGGLKSSRIFITNGKKE